MNLLDALSPWANIFWALTAIVIALIWLKLYQYLKTPWVLVISCGFIWFALNRVLVVLDSFNIIDFPPDVSVEVVGGGFILILLGSIGVFTFTKKAFIEATLLMKEKGVQLPETWKSIDEKITKLKRDNDAHFGVVEKPISRWKFWKRGRS